MGQRVTVPNLVGMLKAVSVMAMASSLLTSHAQADVVCTVYRESGLVWYYVTSNQAEGIQDSLNKCARIEKYCKENHQWCRVTWGHG